MAAETPSLGGPHGGSRSYRPPPKNELVAAQMSRMPRESTTPEILFRRALHAAGFRFRIHRRDLPGRPDVVLPRAKLAIFIDGCYWHACEIHGTLPKNNREWWRAKFEENRKRDRRKDEALRALGWTPVHFWEHEAVEHMVEVVHGLWNDRTGRAVH